MKDFENMPFRGSMWKTSDNNDPWSYRGGYNSWGSIKGRYVRNIVSDTADRFISKQFAKAFSYFCTIVPAITLRFQILQAG